MRHDATRSGNWWWSRVADLGASFIGPYLFYLLNSSFFWLTIPLPSNAVPHPTDPPPASKSAFSGCTGYLYLKRYVRDPEFAVAGGTLYVFSGFSIYNISLNHSHGAIIVFSLLLWAMDEYMYYRRRGIFAVTVFTGYFVNCYFFVKRATLYILYWLVRVFCGGWKIAVKDFLPLPVESVLGVVLSSALLVLTIPTVA